MNETICLSFISFFFLVHEYLVWAQWWSFADVSQQGLDFSKKISKRKLISWFDFQRCSHGLSKKSLKLTFTVTFLCQKWFDFFSLKNISLEDGFLLMSFFENFNFWSTLFTKIMLIFQLLDLEWRLIWQKICFMKKCYFSLN